MPEDPGIDWVDLIRLAEHHGLLPFLHRRLATIQSVAIPDWARRTLYDRFRANELRNRVMVGELLRCHRSLAAEGIHLVAFKGIVLAIQAYEHVALRQFGDIDLLVAESDVPRAQGLIEQLGYRLLYPREMLIDPMTQRLTAFQTKIYREYFHAVTLESADRVIQIDLHWRLSPRWYADAMDPAMLRNDARAMAIDGHTLLCLSPEHQLLNLCMHAAKDEWRQLKWVVDIDRILRTSTDFDWGKLEALARRGGARRMLGVALNLAGELLGTPNQLHASLRVASAARRSGLGSARRQLAQVGVEPNKALRCLGINLTYLRLSDNLVRRVSYLWRVMTLPRVQDVPQLGLEEAGLRLWPLQRPVRVMLRCARRAGRRAGVIDSDAID